MIKVGQVYKTDQAECFVVTYIGVYTVTLIFEDGYVIHKENRDWITKCNELIAEYPTWQEAVNSKEFNNGTTN